MLLARLLSPALTAGALDIVGADGRRHRVGVGTPSLTLRLHDRALHRDLVVNPRLRFGEAYMDGRLSIEGGSVYDFLALLCAGPENVQGALGNLREALSPALRLVQQNNPLRRSRRNVAHHYDLSRAFFELFLDRDLQYSCAYFTAPGIGLDEAQEAKKRHIAAKLLLRPGMRVLDIGCGWGGMALYLARMTGAQVTGITLSAEQLAVARERAAHAGLAGQVRFEQRDYRQMQGRFDRIVSVGMFEHVGVPHYPAFFAKLRDLLAEDGVAVLHSIGRSEGPGSTNPWFRKYIFPGGYSPALSEVIPVVEKAGLWNTDVEILRLHYAETLRHWRERFAARREGARAMYDERFCRMWEFYLAGAEISFRYQGHMVFQMQLARSPGAVPLVRDYMHRTETALADAVPPPLRTGRTIGADNI
ncbi:class I SAM-dependent methyltransferase [Azospirillum sp. YIM DDC1]|uniref:Class I SAM-dependent methyltransferase n=1 Tax=Azospirillum aestuarii TaxID=2802052 RepID=A0ABS1I0N5_9PROT|nr:cyclopropane-fatty-acyl-phospholipid synthase family protein [Azospirillum aestuarii]MBK4720622.1 class I SAM-dependent methyltransferase [Azospirillum aestuarii]TWA88045.1 cyclopropane-fatty-acyl-phospholipid synthase [Azospirillum brasilense]